MQTNLAVLQRNAQFNQSSLNDKALSLSNDLIVGCRTIKCYGWEQHYLDEIRGIRKMQFRDVWKLNMIMTFGSCLFQQMGLVVVVIITTVEWSRGKEL